MTCTALARFRSNSLPKNGETGCQAKAEELYLIHQSSSYRLRQACETVSLEQYETVSQVQALRTDEKNV